MEKKNQELQSVSTQTSTSDKQTCKILGNGRFCYQITRPFENQIKIDKHFFCLPCEILCQIFSHLDGKSRKSVAATCNHFFSILRGNEKTSGLLILSITLKNLSEKIESEEWNWERWPCPRTTKLDGPHSEDTCQICIIETRPNSWDPNYTPGVDFLDHKFLSSKNSG